MRLMPSLLLALLAHGALAGETLLVKIENNRSPGATLYIAVYPGDADGWDAQPLSRHKLTLPEHDSVTKEIELESGRYALRAFVDLDGDGELATNARDRPAEPFASSIGTGRYNPSVYFSRSVFVFDAQRNQVDLSLRYPEGTE